MDLFSNEIDTSQNLLPKDGTVNYYGKIMSCQEANYYLETLLNTIECKNAEAIIYGKLIITRRKVIWHGDMIMNTAIPIQLNGLCRGQMNY
ncbi:MAG: hypothetical protein H7Y42_19580 [Chitinophagaceae bacterium]|nr:hypothetical protein [Chitinophagaceae bacterium]